MDVLLVGLFLGTAGGGFAAVRYVDANSASPSPPYTNWATAARSIQEAVDAAGAGETVVVTNGTYATGGRALVGTMTNRVAVDKPLALRSVNGPQFTIIQGEQVPGTNSGIRCVYVTNYASLSGFTVTNGAADSGGGVYSAANAAVSNCVIVGNKATYGGGAYGGTLYNCTLTGNSANGGGGGAYESTLNNCTLTGNSAGSGGGGALYCTLNNCTLTGNSATWAYGRGGGGAYFGTLNNCIVHYNSAPNGSNYHSSSVNYCCTTPMPTNGVGNITNAPLFLDYAGGNLRPQSNSPCINAGLNTYAPGPTDLDGNPRIVSGTVDIGAYESQGNGSVISYAWLQQFSLPTDGSADFADVDADGHTTRQEWRCQTDPTNALSVLRLLSASSDGTNVTVTWQSVADVSYFLERSTNLASWPCFLPLASDIVGQPGTTHFTDTNAASLAPLFYRVRVGN
jgi:hypothetical protein